MTPSSKVVGDLAQFMVAQGLEPQDVLEQAATLPFPESVIQYFQGAIGIPPGGFPEPLRTKVLAGRGGAIEGRPGASMPSYDFDEAAKELKEKYGPVNNKDVLSHALYPQVFNEREGFELTHTQIPILTLILTLYAQVFTEWKEFEQVYGDVEELPTHLFLKPLEVGEEVEMAGKTPGNDYVLKLVSKGTPNDDGIRQVVMERNGERWFIPITDDSIESSAAKREKASAPGEVGSTMPGVIVDVTVRPRRPVVQQAHYMHHTRPVGSTPNPTPPLILIPHQVKPGDVVKEGEKIAVLSAMKMETVIPAPKSGTVSRVLVSAGDKVEGDDLLAVIDVD